MAIQQTLQIDKLLQTVVNQKASDLHITSGQPPVLRLSGRMVRLETKSLEAEDCVALMKSITPERNQQELQEEGGTDFGFAYGEAARFRVSVFRQNPTLLDQIVSGFGETIEVIEKRDQNPNTQQRNHKGRPQVFIRE